MDLLEAKQLAERLMLEHALSVRWQFRFDSAKRRFGSCNYTKRVITLSKWLTWLNDETEVRDTILHEIAHAKAGQAAGHGPRWKAHARALGCSAERCFRVDQVAMPKAKYRGVCPACRRTIFRDKKRNISCGHCSRRYQPKYAFVWTNA
jgi:predicted SprT family Zn-dependent metalloprotease